MDSSINVAPDKTTVPHIETAKEIAGGEDEVSDGDVEDGSEAGSETFEDELQMNVVHDGMSTAAGTFERKGPVPTLRGLAPSQASKHRRLMEDRLRALTAAHKENLRRLGQKRQTIVRQQMLYGTLSPPAAAAAAAEGSSGAAVSGAPATSAAAMAAATAAAALAPALWRPASGLESREVRAAARERLVQQLMAEHEAAQAALGALKQGASLSQSRLVGRKQYLAQREMQGQQGQEEQRVQQHKQPDALTAVHRRGQVGRGVVDHQGGAGSGGEGASAALGFGGREDAEAEGLYGDGGRGGRRPALEQSQEAHFASVLLHHRTTETPTTPSTPLAPMQPTTVTAAKSTTKTADMHDNHLSLTRRSSGDAITAASAHSALPTALQSSMSAGSQTAAPFEMYGKRTGRTRNDVITAAASLAGGGGGTAPHEGSTSRLSASDTISPSYYNTGRGPSDIPPSSSRPQSSGPSSPPPYIEKVKQQMQVPLPAPPPPPQQPQQQRFIHQQQGPLPPQPTENPHQQMSPPPPPPPPPQQVQLQLQQQSAAIDDLATALPPGHPAASDPALVPAVIAHTRQMAILRMAIERARGEGELEQARGTVLQLRRQQQQHLQDGQQGQQLPSSIEQYVSPYVQQFDTHPYENRPKPYGGKQQSQNQGWGRSQHLLGQQGGQQAAEEGGCLGGEGAVGGQRGPVAATAAIGGGGGLGDLPRRRSWEEPTREVTQPPPPLSLPAEVQPPPPLPPQPQPQPPQSLAVQAAAGRRSEYREGSLPLRVASPPLDLDTQDDTATSEPVYDKYISATAIARQNIAAATPPEHLRQLGTVVEGGEGEGAGLGVADGPPGGVGVGGVMSSIPMAFGSLSPFTNVLEIHLQTVGPFSRQGSYRLRAVLYDGFQPMEAAPGVLAAVSSRPHELGAPVPGNNAPTTTTTGPSSSASDPDNVSFHEVLRLVGVPLPPTAILVFELYLAKQVLAGLPSREALVAWAFTPLALPLGAGGEGGVCGWGALPSGRQSVPLFRQPLMLAAAKKYGYERARVEFELVRRDGNPGDIAVASTAAAANSNSAVNGNPNTVGSASNNAPNSNNDASTPRYLEDLPGVSVDAWARVTRGPVVCDLYTPGDGFVVCVDGARGLPGNLTVSRVAISLWDANRQPLGPGPLYGASWPDSDVFNPRYAVAATLDNGGTRIEDCTATLLLKVTTLERWTSAPAVVGWALLAVFIDGRTQSQPLSAHVADYALNQGAFQLPLHISSPPPKGRLTADALNSSPRVPCASLLVRLLTPEAHRQQRRKPLPRYGDRVYDSNRTVPTQTERVLYNRVMARRGPLVREIARSLAGGRPAAVGPSGQSGGDHDDSAQAEQPGAKCPSTDPELMDWIDSQLGGRTPPPGPDSSDRPLFYNRSFPYQPDLGFRVAVDGAMRLPRALPAAALITFAPPGAFYQDSPLVDDVRVTLDYDLEAPLAAPIWTDGYAAFNEMLYEQGAALLVDIRYAIPSTGTSSPAGWTAIRLFELEGPFLASGYYHAPMFDGLVPKQLLGDLAAGADPDKAIAQLIKMGRIRLHEEGASVLLRLMDVSREGQMDIPATQLAPTSLRRPGYSSLLATQQLGPRYWELACKPMKRKTYAAIKPKHLSDEEWVELINEAVIRVAGLDLGGEEDPDLDPEGESAPAEGDGDGGETSTPAAAAALAQAAAGATPLPVATSTFPAAAPSALPPAAASAVPTAGVMTPIAGVTPNPTAGPGSGLAPAPSAWVTKLEPTAQPLPQQAPQWLSTVAGTPFAVQQPPTAAEQVAVGPVGGPVSMQQPPQEPLLLPVAAASVNLGPQGPGVLGWGNINMQPLIHPAMSSIAGMRPPWPRMPPYGPTYPYPTYRPPPFPPYFPPPYGMMGGMGMGGMGMGGMGMDGMGMGGMMWSPRPPLGMYGPGMFGWDGGMPPRVPVVAGGAGPSSIIGDGVVPMDGAVAGQQQQQQRQANN